MRGWKGKKKEAKAVMAGRLSEGEKLTKGGERGKDAVSEKGGT